MKSKYSLIKILLVLLVFVVAGLIYSCSRKDAEGNTGEVIFEVETEAEESSLEDVSPTNETDSPSLICVHICGAVSEPGVYYLEEGSRVFQGVEMAGGLLEDAAQEYINLADFLSDGTQLYIPFEGEDYALQSGGDDGLVNINTAGAGELMTLPGIGQTKADSIISYREQTGRFESTEDIMNVPGIKDSTFDKIKDYIKVQ